MVQVVTEPETLVQCTVESSSSLRPSQTQGTATEPETVAKFQVWLLKEPDTVAKVMVLAVAEPETVAHFTAWAVAAHETVLAFIVNLPQSLSRSQKSWHGCRRA